MAICFKSKTSSAAILSINDLLPGWSGAALWEIVLPAVAPYWSKIIQQHNKLSKKKYILHTLNHILASPKELD